MSTKVLKITIQERKGKLWWHLIWILIWSISNKKLDSLVTKLFVRGRKLNIYLVFVTQSNFPVPKDTAARLNKKHFFIKKIRKEKRFNKLLLIIRLILTSKNSWFCTKNALQKKSSLVTDTNFSSDNWQRSQIIYWRSIENIYNHRWQNHRWRITIWH